MAIRGGNGQINSGTLEGPYDLFSSVTTTATATTHNTPDFVSCRGARAVYMRVYSKSGGTTALTASSSTAYGYAKSGLAVSAAAAALGVVFGQPGAVALNLGGTFVYTPIAANGIIPCQLLGASIVVASGIAPNDLACDAYVYW